jgi:hypothetical protein
VGDERDRAPHRAPHADDEPDVEAHRHKLHSEDAEKKDDGDDDTPDVEAHAHKHV